MHPNVHSACGQSKFLHFIAGCCFGIESHEGVTAYNMDSLCLFLARGHTTLEMGARFGVIWEEGDDAQRYGRVLHGYDTFVD